jgi:transposase
MAAPLGLAVDDSARRVLAERFEQTRDAETRLRYQMVLLAAEGRTAPAIAPLVRRSADTVTRVLRRYLATGPDGVPHRRRPGRASPAPPSWETELRRVIDLDPHTVGVRSANWTTGLLADYLARVTGHRSGLETVRKALHRAGYVCKRPRWVLDRKAEEQAGWPVKDSGWRCSTRPPHHQPLHPSPSCCRTRC